MRFLILIKLDETVDHGPPPPALIEAVNAFRSETSLGWIVDDAGLAPTSEGLQVRSAGGEVVMMDGPFAETKEVVGGFFVVDSPSADDAAELTRRFMMLHAEHWPSVPFIAELRQMVSGVD